MASLGSAVGLLLAVSDLKLVRSVTRAINADRPKDGPLGTIRPTSATLYARGRRYERPVGTVGGYANAVGGAKYLAGAVHGYRDRYDGCAAVCGNRPVPPVDGVDAGYAWYTLDRRFGHWRYPFDPVWAHLPPVHEGRTVVKIQVVRPKVDLKARGTVLDLFA